MPALLLPLLLLFLGSAASTHTRLPILYLQEPGGRLELDPRVQRETPAFYDAGPDRYQREIQDAYDLDRYQKQVPDASEPDRYQREVQDVYEPDRYQGGILDPYDTARHQRDVPDPYEPERFEVPDAYQVDRFQRKVSDAYEPDRLKRKSPLSFLFFEKDGGSAGQVAERVSRDGGGEGQRDNGSACVSSACNSSCLASGKQIGGRCRGGQCVCGARTFKKRFGNKMVNKNYTKENKPYKKLTR